MTEKTTTTVRLSAEAKSQLDELADTMAMNLTEVIALSIERLYQERQSNVSEYTLRTLNMCSRETDPGSSSARQSILRTLGDLAIPPKGHSCPMCSSPGDLYCLDIAIQRVRGIKR